MTKKNILITGTPGIGKTTLIKKLSEALKDLHPVGFYTSEIREKGIRKGFELISLNGKKRPLSHTEIKSPYRVGKYRVDIKGFEEFLASITFLESASKLIIIDEIGKMECFSEKFKTIIKEILNSEKLVIATISLKDNGFISEIKRRSDVMQFEINKDNRESLSKEIIDYAKRIKK